MNDPLIVFDSGIGGFSILKYLLNLATPILYYADSANFPYGDKEPSWVASRLLKLASDFKSYNPQGVVIACNTATTTIISDLREILSCPVFGVEPIVKPVSHYHNPVVWGTPVTVNSARAQDLRAEHGEHIRYYTPHNLAYAIERGDQVQIANVLREAKHDLGEVDAIGLSCTHYPLIHSQIQAYFPNTVILDPSAAVAAHIQQTLRLEPRDKQSRPVVQFFSTNSNLLELERAFAKYVNNS